MCLEQIRLPTETGYPAPSWSWAAANDQIEPAQRSTYAHYLVKTVEAGVYSSGDPFLQVSDGFLSLRAQSFEMGAAQEDPDKIRVGYEEGYECATIERSTVFPDHRPHGLN